MEGLPMMIGKRIFAGGLVITVLLLTLLCPALYAGTTGTYIKDDRDLDEIGLKGTMTVKAIPGANEYRIEMVIANPALCGGALAGDVTLKNQTAVLIDDSCRVVLTFERDWIDVSRVEGSSCLGDRCPVNGRYIRRGVPGKPIPALIKDIRKHYAYINKQAADWESLEREVTGMSAEGGRLKAWIYNGWVKKIAVTLMGETGKSYQEFYYFDNDLLFSFQRLTRYQKPFGPVAEERDYRYYFHQGNMIRMLDPKKKEALPTSGAFAKARSRVGEASDEYFRMVDPSR